MSEKQQLANPEKRPDAVLIPRSYPVPPENPRRDQLLKQIFAPILGEPRVISRQSGARQSLLTRSSEPDRNHRYWPKGHEREGQEFYRWERSTVPGIFFGYLTEESIAHIEERQAHLEAFDDPTVGQDEGAPDA